MNYLHYIKYQGDWYYYFSNSDYSKDWRPWLRDGFLKFAKGCSKTEAKLILENMFPGRFTIYTVLYHDGPSHLQNDTKSVKNAIRKERHVVKRSLREACQVFE